MLLVCEALAVLFMLNVVVTVVLWMARDAER